MSRSTLISTIVVLILAGLSFYFYHQSTSAFEGPGLSISAPLNGSTIETALVEVAGSTNHISKLTINGHEAFTDEQGNFSKYLLLAPGYNIIKVTAIGRFGKEEQEVVHLVRTF